MAGRWVSEEAVLQGKTRGRRTRTHPQLAVDGVEVPLDCSGTQEESLGDLWVGETFGGLWAEEMVARPISAPYQKSTNHLNRARIFRGGVRTLQGERLFPRPTPTPQHKEPEPQRWGSGPEWITRRTTAGGALA
jgi:hypothetical protein